MEKVDKFLNTTHYKIAWVGTNATILTPALLDQLVHDGVRPVGNTYILLDPIRDENALRAIVQAGWRQALVEEVGYDFHADPEDVARGLFYNDEALNAVGEWCAWGKPHFTGYAVMEPGFSLLHEDGLEGITFEKLVTLDELYKLNNPEEAVTYLFKEEFTNWTDNTTFTQEQVWWWYKKQGEYRAVLHHVREFFCPICNRPAVLSTAPLCDKCLKLAATVCIGDAQCPDCENGTISHVYHPRQGWPEVALVENCPYCHGSGYYPDATQAYRFLEAVGRVSDAEEAAIKFHLSLPCWAVIVEVGKNMKPTGKVKILAYDANGALDLQPGWEVAAKTLYQSTAEEKAKTVLMKLDGKPAFEEFATEEERQERYGQISLFGGEV